MFPRLPFKSITAVSAIAAAGALLAPMSASAQTYGYTPNHNTGSYGQRYDYGQAPYGQSQYGYDQYGRDYNSNGYCRNDAGERRAAGASFGAILGAVAGSQLGARGRRTEGSVLGGVVGAAIGAGLGDSAGRCDDRSQSSYGYGYDDRRYNSAYGNGGTYGYPSDNRTYGYDRHDYGRSDTYGDDRHQYGYQQPQSGYQSGCRTIETQTRGRDGRLVTRYEQSCPNRYEQGRY